MNFSVFHKKRPTFGIEWLGDDLGDIPPDRVLLADFERVAIVNCENLEDVFRVTNHIDESWQNNPEVVTAVERARSTSVGDVVITADGKAFLCDHVGWVEVKVEDAYKEWPRVWPVNLNTLKKDKKN